MAKCKDVEKFVTYSKVTIGRRKTAKGGMMDVVTVIQTMAKG